MISAVLTSNSACVPRISACEPLCWGFVGGCQQGWKVWEIHPWIAPLFTRRKRRSHSTQPQPVFESSYSAKNAPPNQRIVFHDLRHTFSVLALQNGVDVKTLSAMLGHYSAGFTLDTYAHVTTSMQKQAANAVGSFLSGTLQP
ncbi:site-specific integrase [uncultured Oscillibacter sp.]|nr:site-specific integrase [uncultured Oscillibacter sp.]